MNLRPFEQIKNVAPIFYPLMYTKPILKTNCYFGASVLVTLARNTTDIFLTFLIW